MTYSVLVTGSDHGLGLEIVRFFTSLDDQPEYIFAVCNDPSIAAELLSVAIYQPNVKIIRIDVTEYRPHKEAFEYVDSFVGENGLDLLINASEIFSSCDLTNGSPSDIMKTININSVAAFGIIQTFLPLIRMSARNKRLSCITKRPVIVNLTSLSGWFTAGKQPDYAYPTSKACLNMLTKSLSIDLAPEGIRVVGMMPEVGQSIPFIAEKMVQTIFNLFNREVSCTEGNIFFNYDGVSIAW